MSGVLGPIIAIGSGTLFAVVAGFGIVNSTSSTPAPVDQPFIVYGSTN